MTNGRIVQPEEPFAVLVDGRYVIFQMAEVAVSRQMFADILSLISRLQAPPPVRAKRRGSALSCRQAPASTPFADTKRVCGCPYR